MDRDGHTRELKNSARNARTRARRLRIGAKEDSGAVLVLALVFMVAGSLIVTGLLFGSGNDLINSGNFATTRSNQYAANGAMQAAVYNLRFQPSSNQLKGPCPTNGLVPTNPFTISERQTTTSIWVWCDISVNPGSSQSRTVDLWAYACNPGSATCSANPNAIGQATVFFNDFDSSGNNSCEPAGSPAVCGIGMTVQSWQVQPAIN